MDIPSEVYDSSDIPWKYKQCKVVCSNLLSSLIAHIPLVMCLYYWHDNNHYKGVWEGGSMGSGAGPAGQVLAGPLFCLINYS